MMVTSVLLEKEKARTSLYSGWICSLLRRFCGFPVLLGVLIAGGVFLVIPKTTVDPDIGWHLRNAQYQLQHHTFLRQDVYSFTTPGKPWMDHEWLAEIPFYLGWKWFGSRGIFSVTYALIVAILLGVYWLAWGQSGNPKSAFLVALLAILLASVSFGPRTLLFGWLFLILELGILYGYQRGRDLLWALPLLFLVWVNTHGSWIIGLVLFILFTLSGCLDARWGLIEADGWSVQQRRRLIGVIACSTVALFANPYGWRLVAYPFDLAFKQRLNIANVVEWRTLDFHSPRGKIVLAILMLGIVLQLVRWKSWKLHEAMFLLVGIYAGFTYSRFLFLTAILVLPFLTRDIEPWLPPYRPESDKRWLNLVIIGLCIAGICFKYPGRRQLLHVEADQCPLAAGNYLNSLHPAGNLLNDYLWGGYLIWRFPQARVFIDSRVDVFEYNGVFKDYLDIIHLRNSLGLLDKYRIRYVLFEEGTPLSYLLEHTPGWKIDYQDKTAILFERNAPAIR